MKATATLRYMKGSAQKVRLVADLVRGKSVNDALAILRHTPKVAARDIEKTLRSAVANAEQKEAQLDVDELVVRKIFVDKGPQEQAGPAGADGAGVPGPPPQEPPDDRSCRTTVQEK